MAEADLEQEKCVIGQEIAEAADTPDDQVFDLAQAHAFPGQALGRPILGTVESIGRATTASLGDYHRALYSPDRIVVSGRRRGGRGRTARPGRGRLRRCTGRAPGGLSLQSGRFVGGAEAEARKLEQAHLVLLLPGVGASDPDYFALRLFAEILGGGHVLAPVPGRARGDAASPTPSTPTAESYEDAGVLGVYAGSAAADAARAARVAAEQIAALADAPLPAELARAKAQLKAHLFMGRESPLARAEQAAAHLHLFDRLLTPEVLGADIDATTLEDLRRVGGRLLGSGRTAMAVLGPKRAGAALQAFTPAAKAA